MKDRKIKGNSFPFPFPVMIHQWKAIVKRVLPSLSPITVTAQIAYFSRAKGGHPCYVSGSDFMEVFGHKRDLAQFPTFQSQVCSGSSFCRIRA
jgi:hypothetical protein